TVETFLTKQGYKLAYEGSLRKRFGNALVWYNVLQDATTRHIDQILRVARCHAIEIDNGMDISLEDEDEHNEEDSPIVVAGFKRGHDEDNVEEPPNPFPDPLARVRPSDYLRARCPLCFGGEFPWARTEDERPDDDPDAIVCIDACFTQKRNRQARDPPRTHPRTVFIPEADAEAMEKHVEFIRSKRARSIKKPNTEEPDHFEGSLRVPKSVLDGCEAGFTAADSRRDKAST
ncbi:hypothetical protein DXG01_013537, partial [Tephrocybe rancida]